MALHETCVENFLFSGVLCPCRAMCALHKRNTAHTAHVLCPPLSRVCIAMFWARCTHTARLVAHLVARVFLGEYSFGRFPICSQERRPHSMALVRRDTQFIFAVHCAVVAWHRQREESSSMAEEEYTNSTVPWQGRRPTHFFGHWAALPCHHPPFGFGWHWPNPG